MSLLTPSTSYKPFQYPWAMELAEKHEKIHWIHQEIDFSSDVKDWQQNLEEGEKNLLHQILKLFTQSDVQVGQNYIDNLLPKFKNNEIRNMLLSFASREGIHQRAYAALIETLNLPDSDFEAFLEFNQMVNKIEFMKDNDTTTQSGIALSLVKNIFTEGVSLFGSFVMLLNFQRHGKLLGMNTIVRWSILDENEHCEGLIRLFREYCEEHPRVITDDFKKKIYEMARTIYKLESKFIDLAYKLGGSDNLEKSEVKEYMKYLIDRRLITMGLKGNYRVKVNPIPWLEEIIGSPIHENFFETQVTDYQKGGMEGSWDKAW